MSCAAEDTEQRSSRKRAAEQELEQPVDAAQEESRAEGTDAEHEGGEAWDRTLGERVRALQMQQVQVRLSSSEQAPGPATASGCLQPGGWLSKGPEHRDRGIRCAIPMQMVKGQPYAGRGAVSCRACTCRAEQAECRLPGSLAVAGRPQPG